MSWNQVEGYWTQFLGRIREIWGVFRHNHLDIINGQRAQVMGLAQRRYGAAETRHESASGVFDRRSDIN